MGDERRVAVSIAQEGLGQGAPELRARLMRNFLHALEAERRLPYAICLYTEGVRLAVTGSPVLDCLKMLEALGVPILICRTCLEYYGLLEQVAAGRVSTMGEIVSVLFEADSVVSP